MVGQPLRLGGRKRTWESLPRSASYAVLGAGKQILARAGLTAALTHFTIITNSFPLPRHGNQKKRSLASLIYSKPSGKKGDNVDLETTNAIKSRRESGSLL